MSNSKNAAQTQVVEVADAEVIADLDRLPDVGDLLPQMTVVAPIAPVEEEVKPCPVSDEMLLGIYDEILTDIRADRAEADKLMVNFMEMVFNEGDATTSSKEAMVRLFELKMGAADKATKIADLMTRVKLKERDTFKPYMNQKNEQNNTTVVVQGDSHRDMLKSLNGMQKKIMKGKG